MAFAIPDFCRLIGYDFRDQDLLTRALIHPSVVHGRAKRSCTDYERLEFLGDRVLGLVIAELLYRQFPQDPEGDLAKRHVALVRREALARIAKDIRLGEVLTLSPGEDQAGGRDNPGLLSDACEAVIGAIFQDGGFDPARDFVLRRWVPLMDELAAPPKDAKTMLQEWSQKLGFDLPHYAVTEQSGQAHNPHFVVQVSIPGHGGQASGQGGSKRAAEQAAAQALLEVVRT